MEALEYVKVHYSQMLDPRRDTRLNATVQVLGQSALVVDAKALYDAAQKPHVHNFDDKRTGIEVQVLKERMQACELSNLMRAA